MVGKYVNYTPTNGTYSKDIVNKYSGYTGHQEDFITDTSIDWRIWSIEDNVLTLIAEKPISTGGYSNDIGSGMIYFQGALGYNNGITLLQKICKTCYSNTNIGAVARSITIDDITHIVPVMKKAEEETSAVATGIMGAAPIIWEENESQNLRVAVNNRKICYELTSRTYGTKQILKPYMTRLGRVLSKYR